MLVGRFWGREGTLFGAGGIGNVRVVVGSVITGGEMCAILRFGCLFSKNNALINLRTRAFFRKEKGFPSSVLIFRSRME